MYPTGGIFFKKMIVFVTSVPRKIKYKKKNK